MVKSPFYLVYDSDCTLCENFKNTVKGFDLYNRIHPVPFEDPLSKQLLPQMDYETFMGSIHLVSPDGEVKNADKAVTQILRLLPLLSPLGWFLDLLPGKNRINPFLYQLLSSQRHNF